MAPSTIYSAAGIADPTAGLLAAVKKANLAVVAMRTKTPALVGSIVDKTDRPQPLIAADHTRVTYNEYEDAYSVSAQSRKGDESSWTRGSVDDYIAGHTTPANLLLLTELTEALAAECERLAAERQDAIIVATSRAVDSARPALEKLAARAERLRLTAEVESLRRRVAALEDDGSNE